MSLNFEYGPRKAPITIKPNDTIAEALSQFCKKFALPEGCWTVLNGRKEVDLSLTFRLSGLTSNSKLCLVKNTSSETQEVNIALQMSSGTRLIAKFPATTALWDILKHWEKEKGLNLTRDGDFPTGGGDKVKVYMQPVIIYTTKEIGTNKDLRSTTLVKLGISTGNSVLRLLHKYTTVPVDQFLQIDDQSIAEEQITEETLKKELEAKRLKAQQENAERTRLERERTEASKIAAEEDQKRMAERVQQYKKEEEEEKKINLIAQQIAEREKREREERDRIEAQLLHQQQLKRLEATTKLKQEILSEQSMLEKKRIRESTKEIVIPERNIEVFAPSSIPFDPRSFEIPDHFYDITPEDIQLNASIIKERKLEQEKLNSTLRTKEMRERERVKKWSKYKKCLLRVRFPDRIELQATFSPLEKPSSLYQLIKDSLSPSNQNVGFYLYVSPPKTILNPNEETNFRDLGFLPAALVHFAINEGSQMSSPFIQADLFKNITEKIPPPANYVPTPKSEQIIVVAQSIEPQEEHQINTETTTTTQPTTETDNKNVPNWFSRGKKF